MSSLFCVFFVSFSFFKFFHPFLIDVLSVDVLTELFWENMFCVSYGVVVVWTEYILLANRVYALFANIKKRSLSAPL